MNRCLLVLALGGTVAGCCGRPCLPVAHGREPLGGIWWMKAGDGQGWAAPELDETEPAEKWRVVDVPGDLREYFRKVDGDLPETAWLRVRFPGGEGAAARGHRLWLGTAGGKAEVFVNGRRLAEGPPWRLPPGVIAGENVLAVRFSGCDGAAGILDGPVALAADGEPGPAARPAAVRELAGAHAKATYDPGRHRLTSFATAAGAALLDDAHFILRTGIREYDLSRIPEVEVETLPGGRGVRTLHVLEGEGIRFEAWYVVPDACGWPALAVVGEASAWKGGVDIDLVYHATAAGVVGAGGHRRQRAAIKEKDAEDGAQRLAWGRLFVHAPNGAATELPESVRKYYTPDGAFELVKGALSVRGDLPYPIERSVQQGATVERLCVTRISWEEAGLSWGEFRTRLSNLHGISLLTPTEVGTRMEGLEFSVRVANLSALRFLCWEAGNRGCEVAIDEAGAIWWMPAQPAGVRDPATARALVLDYLKAGGLGEPDWDRAERSEEGIRVTTHFEDQPLGEVIDFLREFTGENYVVDPDWGVNTTRVTYQCENKPLLDALGEVLGPQGGWFIGDGAIHITTAEKAREGRSEHARRGEMHRRWNVWPVTASDEELTRVWDRLLRLDGMPLVPDRDVWEKAKSVRIHADAEPLESFLDRVLALVGAKRAWQGDSLYLYVPAGPVQ